MMKKSASLGMITVVLLVSLALMGVAYGAWSSPLYINGTVNTASFNVHFSSASMTACGPTATCLGGVKSGDNKTVEYSVIKAYPDLSSTVSFTIQNDSNIPVKVSVSTGPATPPTGVTFTSADPILNGDSVSILAGASYPVSFTVKFTDALAQGQPDFTQNIILTAVQNP
jgi:hypothetical protein